MLWVCSYLDEYTIEFYFLFQDQGYHVNSDPEADKNNKLVFEQQQEPSDGVQEKNARPDSQNYTGHAETKDQTAEGEADQNPSTGAANVQLASLLVVFIACLFTFIV